MSSVSASRKQQVVDKDIAMGQDYMRQDVNMRGGLRCDLVSYV